MSTKTKTGEASSDWMETVWRRNSDIIYKLCEVKCDTVEEAKDLFQTVALKFCQNAQFLRNREALFPWLVRVMHNAHCDMVADRRSTYPMSAFGRKAEYFNELSEERSVFFQEDRDVAEDYETLFSLLSPLERMIVEMTYVGGFPTEEISSVIGLSNNAVRKRRHFAIQKMRKAVFHIE